MITACKYLHREKILKGSKGFFNLSEKGIKRTNDRKLKPNKFKLKIRYFLKHFFLISGLEEYPGHWTMDIPRPGTLILSRVDSCPVFDWKIWLERGPGGCPVRSTDRTPKLWLPPARAPEWSGGGRVSLPANATASLASPVTAWPRSWACISWAGRQVPSQSKPCYAGGR